MSGLDPGDHFIIRNHYNPGRGYITTRTGEDMTILWLTVAIDRHVISLSTVGPLIFISRISRINEADSVCRYEVVDFCATHRHRGEVLLHPVRDLPTVRTTTPLAGEAATADEVVDLAL